MYTVGSLFAGIGGICSGFKQAGFNVIWANDIFTDPIIDGALEGEEIELQLVDGINLYHLSNIKCVCNMSSVCK